MKTLYETLSFLILPIDEEDPEKGKLLWLIRLRWVFLSVQFFISIPLLMFQETTLKKLVLYVGVNSFLVAFNAISLGVWKKSKRALPSQFTFFSLAIDLFCFTALYWFLSSELNIDLSGIFFIHAALGAILLNHTKNIIFFSFIFSSLLLIQYNQYSNWNHKHFFLEAFFVQGILFSLWMITTSASRYVLSQREKVNQVKLYAEKLDRLRALGALTAGLSHEFSSPLNTIKLRLDRLNKKVPVEDEDLIEAKSAIEDCEKVIRKINKSQLDSRDFIFDKINLQESIMEIINNWNVDYPKMTVSLKMAQIVPRELKIPLLNFSQGLINILDNSAQSMNGIGQINIELTIEDLQLKISIFDQGKGFSEEILRRFGEPFITTKKNGTGLGLYSFQLFAESMGGSLKISNSSSGGALIEFFAPLSVVKHD